MAKLTKEEIKHIAKLASFRIDDEQSALFADQLSAVLDYVDHLKKAPTGVTQPLYNVNGKSNVFREDKVTTCLTKKDCLRNAPSTYKSYFKVKSIF